MFSTHGYSLKRPICRRQEKERAFAQQPTEGRVLPARYLLPSPTAALQPPVMRFGWRLGHDKLMDLVRRHFPDAIERCHGPPNAGMFDETGTQLEFPPDVWHEINDNILETISGPVFAIEICELLAIPSKWERMVQVIPLYDSQLKDEFGLTIGTNYLGIPDADKIAELQRLIDRRARRASNVASRPLTVGLAPGCSSREQE